jgi:hypothetical protein
MSLELLAYGPAKAFRGGPTALSAGWLGGMLSEGFMVYPPEFTPRPVAADRVFLSLRVPLRNKNVMGE